MCGEKLKKLLKRYVATGSPPHVRGKGGGLDLVSVAARITPACAGKSGEPSDPLYGVEDHPRMCGEKTTQITSIKLYTGSPPHVRGKVTMSFIIRV